jgi:lipoyl(octanoyl) transferase
MKSLTRKRSLKMQSSVPGLVILDPPQSGEINMAVDESLLKNAKPDWPVVLRVYQWDRTTLSLGHFQRLEDRDENALLAKLPWVRRKTGGGAIVHDMELTYSIMIPNRIDQPTKGHSELLYRSIHSALVENLRRLGWDAKLSETCTCTTGASENPEPFLCFSRRSPVDILVDGDKIVGSAQRRSATGLLQHGSFLLRRSQSAPDLCGLLDITASLFSGDPKNLRRKNDSDASSGVGDWVDFLVRALQAGLGKNLLVDWRFATLGDLSLS